LFCSAAGVALKSCIGGAAINAPLLEMLMFTDPVEFWGSKAVAFRPPAYKVNIYLELIWHDRETQG
jgi:hypothetical protein